MQEVAVPLLWPDQGGARHLQLGDITAVLEVTGSSKVGTYLAEGRRKKTEIGAGIGEGRFCRGLKSLKQSAKEIATLLPAQAQPAWSNFFTGGNLVISGISVPLYRPSPGGHSGSTVDLAMFDGANAGDGIWLERPDDRRRGQTRDWLRH